MNWKPKEIKTIYGDLKKKIFKKVWLTQYTQTYRLTYLRTKWFRDRGSPLLKICLTNLSCVRVFLVSVERLLFCGFVAAESAVEESSGVRVVRYMVPRHISISKTRVKIKCEGSKFKGQKVNDLLKKWFCFVEKLRRKKCQKIDFFLFP